MQRLIRSAGTSRGWESAPLRMVFGLEELQGEDWVYLVGLWLPSVAIGVAGLLIGIFLWMTLGSIAKEKLQNPKYFFFQTSNPPPGKIGSKPHTAGRSTSRVSAHSKKTD